MLELQQPDPLHQLRPVVLHIAEIGPNLPCLDRAAVRLIIPAPSQPMLILSGTRPRFARCNAIGNIGGRNGSCRIAVALGYSHSHSLAYVGARLAALGWVRADSYLRDSA